MSNLFNYLYKIEPSSYNLLCGGKYGKQTVRFVSTPTNYIGNISYYYDGKDVKSMSYYTDIDEKICIDSVSTPNTKINLMNNQMTTYNIKYCRKTYCIYVDFINLSGEHYNVLIQKFSDAVSPNALVEQLYLNTITKKTLRDYVLVN